MGVRPFYTCRLLRWSDMSFCYRLACDPDVRAASHDQERPTWFGHLRWMWKWIYSRDRLSAWVIVSRPIGACPIGKWQSCGLIRTSRMPDREGSEIGIAIAQDWRGKGIATGQLHDMAPVIYRLFDGPVYAFIKLDNQASIGSFTTAGYRRRMGAIEYGKNAAMAKFWWRPEFLT